MQWYIRDTRAGFARTGFARAGFARVPLGITEI